MPTLAAKQNVQTWGNSLAVRLTSKIAHAAHFEEGQPLLVEVVSEGVLLRPIHTPRETLAQKLARFDPTKHGGEVMVSAPIGAEVIQ